MNQKDSNSRIGSIWFFCPKMQTHFRPCLPRCT